MHTPSSACTCLVLWPPHCGRWAHARHVPHAVRGEEPMGKTCQPHSGLAVAPQKQHLTFPQEKSVCGGSRVGLWLQGQNTTLCLRVLGLLEGAAGASLLPTRFSAPGTTLLHCNKSLMEGERAADRKGRGKRNGNKMERGGGREEGRETCLYDPCKFQVSEPHYHLAVIIAKLIAASEQGVPDRGQARPLLREPGWQQGARVICRVRLGPASPPPALCRHRSAPLGPSAAAASP